MYCIALYITFIHAADNTVQCKYTQWSLERLSFIAWENDSEEEVGIRHHATSPLPALIQMYTFIVFCPKLWDGKLKFLKI